LKHKDLLGSVSFSAEDEVFFGKIEGIDDLVTFEGTTVEELKSSFIEAVEDYFELCQHLGKPLHKSFKGSFNVRVKPATHKHVYLKAVEMGVSLNQLVEKALDSFLEQENV
jgi:predicted HicB family RNase H-like nuclease